MAVRNRKRQMLSESDPDAEPDAELYLDNLLEHTPGEHAPVCPSTICGN